MSLSPGIRWTVTTQREREHSRTGLGHETLQQTLKHLRDRGDTSATVDDWNGRREVKLNGSLPIGGTRA